MYYKNIAEKNGKLTFKLLNDKNNIPVGLANALRRIMISEIPILCLDKDINIDVNETILHDELIKKRLQLIPIFYNNFTKDYENFIIKLDESNDDIEIKDIYVKDITIENNGKKIDNNKFFVDNDILFVSLKQFNKIHMTSKINLGSSKCNYSAYCPTTIAIYTFDQDENEINKQLKKLKTEDEKLEFKYLDSQRLYHKNKANEPLGYNFKIETVGQLNCKEIFKRSLQIIYDKLETLEKAILNNDEDKITIENNNKLLEAYDYIINDENDTLGNCLVPFLNKNKNISYAGYNVTHPFDEKIVIRIGVTSNKTLENTSKVFIEEINNVKKIINLLKKEWKP